MPTIVPTRHIEALLAVTRALAASDHKPLKTSNQEQRITLGVPSAKLLILLWFVVRDQEMTVTVNVTCSSAWKQVARFDPASHVVMEQRGTRAS